MDWDFAIERQREALQRVLAALVAMAGLAGGNAFTSPLWGRGATAAGRPRAMEMALGARNAHKGEVRPAFRLTLPRHLHRAVLRLLRPAEAAARRLVIAAARGLVVTLPRPRPRKPRPERMAKGGRSGAVTGVWMPPHLPRQANGAPRPLRPSALPLFDPLPRRRGAGRKAAGGVPRICTPGWSRPVPAPPARKSKGAPDDAIDAARLALRLEALASALDDLPRAAKRFARWRMRAHAEAARAARSPGPARPRRLWPLKPGHPPGVGRRADHAIHETLRDAHALAVEALERPDTS